MQSSAAVLAGCQFLEENRHFSLWCLRGRFPGLSFSWRSANPACSWKPCKQPTRGSTEHVEHTGGTCWTKEKEGVNQSRDLRVMIGKEVYKDGEVRVALQNQAELPVEKVEDHCRFCSPMGAPEPNTPIKGWGCANAVTGQRKKKPFPACILFLPMRKEGPLWDCFHRRAPDLCATHPRPSKFV